MTTDTSVKYFSSDMSGAPALSGTAGTLISVLDACLVNGFGSVTVNTLVVASNIATATVSAGHNFPVVGATGTVVRIEGATPLGLNGDWRIQSATSTAFTFTTSGISDQTATGTITAKRAPAGFSNAFSGTNKAAYRADDVASARLYLRVDDTGTTNVRCRGYETMTGVDTGTGLFPTDAQVSGGLYVYKSSAANTTARPWVLVSDGRLVYLFIDSAGNTSWAGGLVFGDGLAYLTPDAFSVLLIAGAGNNEHNFYRLGPTPSGAYISRSYTQLGTSVACHRYSHGSTATGLGYTTQAYPALADNSVHLWPVEYWEGTTIARGMMPGLWNPINAAITQGLLVENIPQLPNRTVLIQTTASATYHCGLDITGPWR